MLSCTGCTRAGGKRRIRVPAAQGFGSQGGVLRPTEHVPDKEGVIPPNADLECVSPDSVQRLGCRSLGLRRTLRLRGSSTVARGRHSMRTCHLQASGGMAVMTGWNADAEATECCRYELELVRVSVPPS